jgi:hypothetical protein
MSVLSPIYTTHYEGFAMMRAVVIFAALVVACGWSLAVRAQYPPPGYGYGGYGGYGGGTVASNNMNGMANMISAKGSYNLQSSQAAINVQDAVSMNIQNRQEWTDAYFEMRAANRAYRAAERGPPPSAEQIARMAANGVPKPISPGEMDPVTGQLAWPVLFEDDMFKSSCAEVEKLMAKQSSQGRLGLTDQNFARNTIDNMFTTLKGEITNVPSQQYVEARSFLSSLMYTLTKTQLN